MEYVNKLGKSFSRLCFGGAGISGEGRGYGFGEVSDEQAEALLKEAYQQGVNIYDFAPIYGFNLAEKRAGRALKNVREKVHLISKCGVHWRDSGRVDMNNDPKIALAMLDTTLKNFQSDYVDFYLVHWPDPKIDIRHTVEGLFNAKEKGKILHIGLCNTNVHDLKLAKEVAPIEAIQGEINLFNPVTFKALKNLLEPETLTMGWGTYDKGILAGTVWPDRKFEKDDCRSWAPWWKKSDWKKRAKKVQSLMQERGLSAEELALAAFQFSLERSDVALAGMKKLSHIKKNLAYLQAPKFDSLEEIYDELSKS